jgi:hypothetical protein
MMEELDVKTNRIIARIRGRSKNTKTRFHKITYRNSKEVERH